jgi:hypothetical protein
VGSATYEELLEVAAIDAAVVGLVLTGSRGRVGAPLHDGSDWDVRLVVRDDALATARARYGTPHGSPVETVVFDLTTFETLALPGGDDTWDRYSYVGVEAVIDKLDGGIGRMLERKARLTDEEARAIAAYELDGYINAMYRSRKNEGSGLPIEAHLDAVESLSPLLTFLFAVHGRVRPFNKWLDWELAREPLDGEPWTQATLLDRLERLASAGTVADQAAMFRDVEVLARDRGHGDEVDSWEPDVAWFRSG